MPFRGCTYVGSNSRRHSRKTALGWLYQPVHMATYIVRPVVGPDVRNQFLCGILRGMQHMGYAKFIPTVCQRDVRCEYPLCSDYPWQKACRHLNLAHSPALQIKQTPKLNALSLSEASINLVRYVPGFACMGAPTREEIWSPIKIMFSSQP